MYKFLTNELIDVLSKFKESNKDLIIMTGAGISAASGIPTFRGKDGYWVVGSINYKPEKIGTMEMFKKHPYDVWEWYIYRKTLTGKAKPNEGHFAIAELENYFSNRFYLITQNVDGLHKKAGNSEGKTFYIHGTLDYMRCAELCTSELFPFPNIQLNLNEKLSETEKKLLKCPNCGANTRPNILWFDEFYNELFYKSETTLKLIDESGLLIVVGTSGSTNLPVKIVSNSIKNNIPIIEINIEENYFSRIVNQFKNGFSIQGESSLVLNEILNYFKS